MPSSTEGFANTFFREVQHLNTTLIRQIIALSIHHVIFLCNIKSSRSPWFSVFYLLVSQDMKISRLAHKTDTIRHIYNTIYVTLPLTCLYMCLWFTQVNRWPRIALTADVTRGHKKCCWDGQGRPGERKRDKKDRTADLATHIGVCKHCREKGNTEKQYKRNKW